MGCELDGLIDVKCTKWVIDVYKDICICMYTIYR